ncbi:hypothetical protein JRQ81_017933 [Phrynocephalus forsythii]|uniref:Uncharacterized protein n=1 Tax=Phrynocephalus forsythii TaxID=171643 RepID=A0A9Q1B0E9_9SAUR|nr:hypothetical protein JRQ81_017933 [Phrynocephalus forsythii]
MTATALASGGVQKHPNPKEDRKLRKPLIERKRRERINNCLDQLKETVVGAFQLDQSKLEKADILEMTVKHLQIIQNSKNMADLKMGLEAQQRYSTGYIQCMHEVHNLLLTCEWMDKTLGARLLNHLLKSLPRSSEETCKADVGTSIPESGNGNPAGSSQSQDHVHATDDKQGSKKALCPGPPSHCSQREMPSSLHPHFAHRDSFLNHNREVSADILIRLLLPSLCSDTEEETRREFPFPEAIGHKNSKKAGTIHLLRNQLAHKGWADGNSEEENKSNHLHNRWSGRGMGKQNTGLLASG